MYPRRLFVASLGSMLLATAALGGQETLSIYTVNYPLQYFAQRIAGDSASVVFPAPSDIDPAFWAPNAETVADYQHADLILLNGAGYAKWVNRAALPRRKLVDTSASFGRQYLEVEGTVTHSHGPDKEHAHTGTAFTTWLDFTQAAAQAQAIAEALIRKQPEGEALFLGNLATLEQDLRDLDRRLTTIVAADPGKPLLASHSIYQYLARRYVLNLESVMWEPDEVPDESQWSELAQRLQSHPARWMIWEAAPNPESRNRLQGMGISSLVFDPAGNRPNVGDFLSLMRRNLEHLQQAYDAL